MSTKSVRVCYLKIIVFLGDAERNQLPLSVLTEVGTGHAMNDPAALEALVETIRELSGPDLEGGVPRA